MNQSFFKSAMVALMFILCFNNVHSRSIDIKPFGNDMNEFFLVNNISSTVTPNEAVFESYLSDNKSNSNYCEVRNVSANVMTFNVYVGYTQVEKVEDCTDWVYNSESWITDTKYNKSLRVNTNENTLSERVEYIIGGKAITASALTLSPDPAGVITGSTQICPGSSGVVYSVPEIANAASYVWTLPSGTTGSSTTNSISVNFSSAYTGGIISVHGSNDTGSGVASSLNVSVKSLAITSQPQRQTVNAGSNATFSLVAEGCNLAYQWETAVTYYGPWVNATVASGGYVGSTTTNSLSVKGTAATSPKFFRCKVSNGSETLYSSVASLTYITAPIFISQSAANIDAAPGQSKSISAFTGNLLDWVNPTKWGYFTGKVSWDTEKQAWKCMGQCAMFLNYASGIAIDPNRSYTLSVDLYTENASGQQNSFGGKTYSASYAVINPFDYATTQGQVVPAPDQWVTYTIVKDKGRTSGYDGWGSAEFSYYCFGGQLNYTTSANSQVTYVRNIQIYETNYPTSYQWSKNGVTIPGATSPTYTIPSVSVNDEGVYRCTASNGFGSAQSSPITLNATLSISSQPTNTTVCEGQDASFSVSSSGANLQYQWESAPTSSGAWTALNALPAVDYSTSTLTIQGTTPAPEMRFYRCKITDGIHTVYSNTVSLAYKPIPIIISQSPTAVSKDINTPVTLGVFAKNGVIWANRDIWVKSGLGEFTWDDTKQAWKCVGNVNFYMAKSLSIPVDPKRSYTISVEVFREDNQTLETMWGGQYYASDKLTPINGSTGTYDYSATNGIQRPAAGQWVKYTKLAKTGEISNYDGWGKGCSYYAVGGLINYGAANTQVTYVRNIEFYETGNPMLYQWSKDGVPITGANTPTYTIPSLAEGDAGQYTCQVTGTCGQSVTSTPIALTVNVPPSITAQPIDQEVCEGHSASFTVTAKGTALTYRWKQKAPGSNDWSYIPAAESSTYTIGLTTPLMNGSQFLCEVSGTVAPTVVSGIVTLTVNTKPSITQQPVDLTVDEGGSAIFSVLATGTDIKYQWKKRADAETLWSDIPNATASTYSIDATSLEMSGYHYMCELNGLCPPSVSSNSGQLIVRKKVIVTISANPSAIYCNGSSVVYTATARNEGESPTYQWKVNGVNCGENSSTFTHTAHNNDEITCLLTSNLSNVGGNPVLSNVIKMSVIPAPSGLEISGNSCVSRGETVTYSVEPIPGVDSYIWQIPGVAKWQGTNSFTVEINERTESGYVSVTPVTQCGEGIPSKKPIFVNYITHVGQIEFGYQESSKPFSVNNYSTKQCFEVVFENIPNWIRIEKWINSAYVVSCAMNSGVNPRSANIIVRYGNVEAHNLEVRQEGNIPEPNQIIQQPINQPECSGSVTFSVVATNAVSYQWQKAGRLIEPEDIDGATSSTYTFTPSSNPFNNDRDYRCEIKFSNGITRTTKLVNVIVPNISNYEIVVKKPLCGDGSPAVIQMESNSYNYTRCFKLLLNNQEVENVWQTNYDLNYTVEWSNITQPGIYKVVLVGENSNCEILIGEVEIVQSQPRSFNLLGSSTLCGSSGNEIRLDGSEQGVSYELTQKYNASGSGITMLGDGLPIVFGNFDMPGNYSVVAENEKGCTSAMNNDIDIVRSEINVLPISKDFYYVGQPATLSLDVVSGIGLTYKWFDNPALQNCLSTNSYLFIPNVTSDMDGRSYYYEVRDVCNNVYVNSIHLRVLSLLQGVITATKTNICQGSEITLTVTGNGSPDPKYQRQWQESSEPFTYYTDVKQGTGANSDSYTTTITEAGIKKFRFRLTYSPGSVAYTPEIEIKTATPPTIPDQLREINEYINGDITMNMQTTGNFLDYQWYFSNREIINADKESYSIIGLQPEHVGEYKCIVSNTCSSVSGVINLNLIDHGKIAMQPKDQRVLVGETALFSIVLNDIGLGIQWQMRTPESTNFSDITGEITPSLNLIAAENFNGNQYRCKLMGVGGPYYSTIARLSVVNQGNGTYIGSNTQPKNWTETKVFNGNENVVGHSKSYADWLGRSLQTQSAELTSGRTIISQVVYDDLGRQVITTLPAAVVNPDLGFKPDFFTNLNGNDYSSADFDGVKLNNPNFVNGAIPNGLGWYYSSNNTEEPIAESQFPYSRVEYSKITGQLRKSTGPGEVYRMGSGHETYGFTLPAVLAELGSFPLSLNDFPSQALTKSISVDAEGKQVVAFSDAQGKTIASGRIGGGNNTHVLGTLPKSTGYLDVHLASGCEGSLVLPSGYTYIVTNLLTENIVTSITSGFYRIETANPAPTDLSIGYDVNYSDLSFNVYDKAGRLKESYSPKSVATNNPALKTIYKYNSLGWLLETNDYEQGLSQFVYRKDGSIRFSQNAEQLIKGYFSYTNYDESERPVESGEYRGSILFSPTMDPVSTVLPINDCYEKTGTMYDLPDADLNTIIANYNQSFTAGRVSKTWNSNSTSWYSYTYDGKIEWVVRRIESISKVITVNYAYDFNGNVTLVEYQKENPAEHLDHLYTYDNDLRLSEVNTKTYNPTVTTTPQAKYYYYAHGPLKRVEYGDKLQGVDYTYTLTGALKAINDPLLSSVDPGKDGYSGVNSAFGKDLFGMALDYYNGDYTRTGINFGSVTGNDRYDGMIKSQRWRTLHDNITPPTGKSWLYSYTYDNRNYLRDANFGTYNNSIGEAAIVDAFSERGMTYDANGNIQSLSRFKELNTQMDNLSYNYSNPLKPNQLSSVADGVNDNTVGSLTMGNSTFTYNALGQMVSKTEGDVTEYYKYNPYGLTEGVYTADDYLVEHAKVRFTYDDNGFRVWKKDYVSTDKPETFYARNASGNILATYERKGTSTVTLFELPVYGSGRIGTMNSALHTTYELTDHLGNVRALFGKATSGLVQLEGYTDYYPYGMVMPGRQYVLGSRYRFGYQGQFAEKEEETGYNHFEARDYYSRIGRWLIPDPAGQYWSPYVGMGNNPVSGVDPDGEWWYVNNNNGESREFLGFRDNIRALFSSNWSLSVMRDQQPTKIEGVICVGIYLPKSEIKQWNPTLSQLIEMRMSRNTNSGIGEFGDKTLLNMTYGSIDDISVLLTHRHLSGWDADPNEVRNQGMQGIISLTSLGMSKLVKPLTEIRYLKAKSLLNTKSVKVAKNYVRIHNSNVLLINEQMTHVKFTIDRINDAFDIPQ